MENLWVDANFKEVQLGKMRIGQAVSLVADIYGDAVTYHGKIIGLGAGTGASFALLPAQNATGNWIKVVQRVPVKIALDPQELKAHPLRVGLSMRAKVDLHQQDGPVVSVHSDQSPDNQTQVYDKLDADADALIHRIISQNLGAPEHANAGAPRHG
jgi:membrane fusion protein (multidrug efflux system)